MHVCLHRHTDQRDEPSDRILILFQWSPATRTHCHIFASFLSFSHACFFRSRYCRIWKFLISSLHSSQYNARGEQAMMSQWQRTHGMHIIGLPQLLGSVPASDDYHPYDRNKDYNGSGRTPWNAPYEDNPTPCTSQSSFRDASVRHRRSTYVWFSSAVQSPTVFVYEMVLQRVHRHHIPAARADNLGMAPSILLSFQCSHAPRNKPWMKPQRMNQTK